ncbi:venom acid phosphatase Acph-1-like [Chrysoperla carnea]|uniref:venom acid phosphatase Acph-1-like n=1 Tax=Chrysoperla carnea TaxID=189513 RepID=UPI001D097D50|nr:venom acid phosphatase Acph-1-like [Chrysoperla carnea]
MIVRSVIVIFVIFILSDDIRSTLGTHLDPSDTVVQVHVSFRHGDRVLDIPESYPNDPYKDLDLYPLSRGHLTNNGKQRAYKLGKMLRTLYNDFLGDIYDAEIVQTISTDFDRTKMSAQLVLAGLFPPNKAQQWDEELLWLPIPVNYIRHEKDTWLKRPNDYCKAYYDELMRVYHDVEPEILQENNETLQYISQHAGKKMNSLLDVFRMQQTQYSEEQLNFTLPEWVKKVYPEPLGSLGAKQMELENHNTLLKRLNGGNILRKILKNAHDKIAGTLEPKGRKIYLYSGHETNAANILIALDIWDKTIPLFSSATIIELVHRNSTNEYGLKVYYHNQIAEEPILLTVPGCGDSFCEIKKFIEVTDDVVPKNYTAECNSLVDIDTLPWE